LDFFIKERKRRANTNGAVETTGGLSNLVDGVLSVRAGVADIGDADSIFDMICALWSVPAAVAWAEVIFSVGSFYLTTDDIIVVVQPLDKIHPLFDLHGNASLEASFVESVHGFSDGHLLPTVHIESQADCLDFCLFEKGENRLPVG